MWVGRVSQVMLGAYVHTHNIHIHIQQRSPSRHNKIRASDVEVRVPEAHNVAEARPVNVGEVLPRDDERVASGGGGPYIFFLGCVLV
jgi:hypothetical protein